MKRIKWNDSWKVLTPEADFVAEVTAEMTAGGKKTEDFTQLPHDAMIHEKRTPETPNAHQTGFYPGGVYTYTKTFEVPCDWRNKTVILEFEGVYANARVFINKDYAGGHPYGYTNFYIYADDFLNYGEMNEIRVVANNSAEPNSRWYSGSGIYRNVNIMVGDMLHIKEDGIKVTTVEIDQDSAVMVVDTLIRNQGTTRRKFSLKTEIMNEQGVVVTKDSIPVTAFSGEEVSCRQRLRINNPKLWNVDTPCLYQCRLSIMEDDKLIESEETMFGIRKLSLDAKRGLCINGQSVKLRGTCIHHDNGIIGACTFERAEERRCQQLKTAGFNCIRSSHHPVSKAMLDACDREGMLVMDELFDCWTRSKNSNDYAQYFEYNWQKDVTQMIGKDYNHPSVILYSIGNEIQEVGTSKGAQIGRQITNYVRCLDDTRYITNAMNGILAGMNRLGEIIMDITGLTPEQMIADAVSQTEEGDKGSDALNNTMDVLEGPLADAIAVSPAMSEILSESEGVVDICGYNYLTARHIMKQPDNPNRVILGTETFPADIARLWEIVRENNNVIGDMTWTGYDYLGESGGGIFRYGERGESEGNWPYSVSCAGDIDIIGNRRPISFYREIIYGLRKDPYIAVERLNHYGETPNKTAWMWKDNIASWTWNGYEGKPAKLDILADADEVELFLNGKSYGRKPAGAANKYMASYELLYEPGELKAVSYRNGDIIGNFVLESADDQVELDISVDRSQIRADGADLSYIMVGLKDAEGRQNLQEKRTVAVSVEGVGTLQGLGNAAPDTDNYYDNPKWETHDGYVLAVVRSTKEAGEIVVTFQADQCETKKITIQTI